MNNQEKRKVFEEHLKEQDRQREKQIERRKMAELHKNNPQEDMLFIQKQFRTLSQQMDDLFENLKKKEATLADLTTHQIVMKNYYLEVNYVLTTYDRQFYKEALEKIHNNILDMKRKLQPKTKFKFSRRKEDFGVQQIQEIGEVKHTEIKQNTIPGIQNREGETITVTTQCPAQGSFKIINCKNTTIELLQKTEILFLKNLTNCTIKAALTKSTVFVDSCTGCQLEINCHQLRIHNTYDSTLSIFVTSKAIIEFCNKVIFRPYNFQYPERQQHELDYERNGKINLWRDIQDFGWLKENQKSPHFQLAE